MIGQRINHYDVRALLGEGGMGAVYLAEHRLIGRKAAVKVLRRELAADPTVVARFLNEARAANAIGHPNIIDIIDVGTLPDGVPYLVMEYLPGESLAARLRRTGRLPLEQAIAFTVQTASALGAAHDKGIVHRDLKPDNIFLDPDPLGGGERVKVLDFGIAKLQVGGPAPAGDVRTRPGLVMGTPLYMSPEQCRGLSDGIGPAADVYSLGLILYEMLCGAPPFQAAADGDLLVMQITERPAPPSSRNPAIPPLIERAILRALAKRPEERFPSMNAFRAALGDAPTETVQLAAAAPVREATGPGRTQILTGQPGRETTLSSSVGVLTAPPSSRRRLVMAAAAFAVVAVAGLAALRLVSGGPAAVPAPSAIAPPPITPLPAPPEPTPPAPTPEPAPPEPVPAAVPDAGAPASAPRHRPSRRARPATRAPATPQPEKW